MVNYFQQVGSLNVFGVRVVGNRACDVQNSVLLAG
jgi:hypothetical protein